MDRASPTILKGSLFALTAFFLMAIFGIFTKMALEEGSAFWVSFIAYLTGTLVIIPYFAYQGFSALKSNRYPLLIGRAVFGTIASFCYTISIHYIPLVNGTLLFNTAPIFIPLIAMFALKAKIDRSTWLAVLIGFVGIIIIIEPTEAIFTQTGNLIGILSGVCLAIAYLLMKLLTSTDPGLRIIFYYLGIGTLMQVPLLFIDKAPTSESSLYAALGGLCLLGAQVCLIQGYRYASAPQIGIYQYTTIIFVGLLDWLLWGMVPSLSEFSGILLVALAGMIIIRAGSRPNKI